MIPTGIIARQFSLVDVAGAGGDATFALPAARNLPFRQMIAKGNAPGSIAITAPHGDAPEVDAGGGVLIASGDGDIWPTAVFYSDGVQWHTEWLA